MSMRSASQNICLFLGRHESVGSGLWVYGRELTATLAGITDDSGIDQIDAVAGGSQQVRAELDQLAEHGRVRMQFLPARGLRRKLSTLLDLTLQTPDCNLVHGTANIVPIVGRCRKILTLHDLLQAYPSQNSSSVYIRLRSWYYRRLLAMMIKRVDAIVTDREDTARSIRQLFEPRAGVHVIYPGLADVYLRSEQAPALPAQQPDSEEVQLLAFASPDPRKNIERVLRSFATVSEECSTTGGWRLTVVVSSGEVRESVAASAARLGCASRIKLLSDIPIDEMPALYQRQTAVLFPSLAEGFGYPIYEALSQGVPVVASAGSLVERLAAAVAPMVVACNPRSLSSIEVALRQISANVYSPATRADIARKVREELSFKKAGAQLSDLYKQILQDVEA